MGNAIIPRDIRYVNTDLGDIKGQLIDTQEATLVVLRIDGDSFQAQAARKSVAEYAAHVRENTKDGGNVDFEESILAAVHNCSLPHIPYGYCHDTSDWFTCHDLGGVFMSKADSYNSRFPENFGLGDRIMCRMPGMDSYTHWRGWKAGASDFTSFGSDFSAALKWVQEADYKEYGTKLFSRQKSAEG